MARKYKKRKKSRTVKSIFSIILIVVALAFGGSKYASANNLHSFLPSIFKQKKEPVFSTIEEATKNIYASDYNGKAFITVNNNIPFFSEDDLKSKEFEEYGSLDYLGRCSYAYANIGPSMMSTEKRSSIGMVKPSGWHTIKYDFIDQKFLYNRCHLIGYQLTGENANPNNLITGTRYMNIDGMQSFENNIARYIKETGNHVLYRVTPIFKGSNLLAEGVLMEAKSIEDNGNGIEFCTFAYNVQPGVTIDYTNGDSYAN